MSENLEDKEQLREYLLGNLRDEDAVERIEYRLMTEDQVADEIGIAECDLIEEYLDGTLTEEDSGQFRRHFLLSSGRKQQLKLTRNLRAYSMKTEIVPPQKQGLFEFVPAFSIRWLRFAALAVVITAVGFLSWRFAIYQSHTDKSLAQLRKAYVGQRPLQPRITALPDYVPYSETRGLEQNVTDPDALRRAEVILVYATENPDDAKAHQALALVYLAQKKYDSAIRQFDIALKAAANSAPLHSDAGAAYLQIAKNVSGETDGAKFFENLDQSLRHLDLAISLAPEMPEPRFNRALCLEALFDSEHAKAAWDEYLSIDPNSKWADEARDHLEKLDTKTPRDLSSEELESQFLDAFRRNDEAEAARLIAENRELIRDKYLPFRLSFSSLKADRDQNETLSALRFASELEMTQTGDSAPKEMAEFYISLSKPAKEKLLKSHNLIREGLDACLKSDFVAAHRSFSVARKDFDEAGDVYGAGIATYLTGYSLFNSGHVDDAFSVLTDVSKWAHTRKAYWLEATVLHWTAGYWLRSKGITRAIATYEQALGLAVRINDNYAAQRNLLMLAQIHSDLGEQQVALGYLRSVLQKASNSPASTRQRLRNLFQSFAILFQARLFSVAQPAIFAAMSIADSQNDPLWMSQSRAFAGIAMRHGGDIEGARRLLLESRAKAVAVELEPTARLLTAFADLNLAEFERSIENHSDAERYYHQAVEYYDSSSSSSFLRDQAHRGLLLTLMDLGRTEAIEPEIQLNIQLAEDYRSTIREDAQYAQFFDSRADIYDIAADVEYERGNSDQAFYYTEMSSARWLLHLMEGTDAQPHILLDGAELNSIVTGIPSDVQVVRYSVLENKTLVWIVSRGRTTTVTLPIGDATIQKAALDLLNIASVGTSTTQDIEKVSRKLYDLLVLPIRKDLDPHMELCIIPSKGLFDVPFAALTDEAGNPLIAHFRILYAPSVSVFMSASKEADARGKTEKESLLAVGNPAIDRNVFSLLPDLPDAVTEAVEIGRFYSPDAQILLRRSATKNAFLKRLPNADIVHFAGHHHVRMGLSPTSTILLAPDGTPDTGELSSAELSKLSLPRTKLVVLSACSTNSVTRVNGEGAIGLSHSILGARVPLVLASLWDVDSRATAELMTQFHMYRKQRHMTTTDALRLAQLDLIKDPSARHSSPYYWAAFGVYGGHASF